MKTLPIGIQDFPTLRERGHVYVDKTKLIQPLLESGGYFFLSRPRRFGKSLLVSTLKAIYDGRKDLFAELWLEGRCDFAVHPVIRLDFSNINFTNLPLDQGITEWLRINALEYGCVLQSLNAKDAFRELILELSKQSKVVVLIDEYDKPITDYLLEPAKRDAHTAVLRGVYGLLKPMNAYLELVFLTGVSKIGKLSLFSDLNNVQDMSLNAKYASICGYSRAEIELGFPQYLESLAAKFDFDLETLWQSIKHWYNGYSWDGESRLYCPFSFLLFLEQQQFKSYWYETGTPTLLLELVRAKQLNPLEFEPKRIDDAPLVATALDDIDPISLMFQTGYLTIDRLYSSLAGVRYDLTFPNFEVRFAFSRSLLAFYGHAVPSAVSGFANLLQAALERLDWDEFFALVNQILAGIPYEIFRREEAYPHSLLHIMLLATGFRTQSQVQTSLGRIDILLETSTHRIVFELKTSGTPDEALLQIEQNQYAAGLESPVVGVGAVFSLERKAFVSWIAQSL